VEELNNKEISIEYYEEIIRKFNSMNAKELIETHKNLIGKKAKENNYEISDCGISFIYDLLSQDYGRSIVYNYSHASKTFMKSKYLSDYLKHRIKKLLAEMDNINNETCLYTEEIIKILNSSKTFNEMDENEIKAIYDKIKIYMSKNKYQNQIIDKKTGHCFIYLLYKLDSKGIISLLKDENYITRYELATQILRTSGLNDRASYYSGRGVNYGDLNDENLAAIFKKLLVIDLDYALNYVEMVKQMKTLGATEFINSFKNLAKNNFKVESSNLSRSNVSLDGLYDEQREISGFISYFSVMNGNCEEYQIYQTEQMKNSFISRINPLLKEITQVEEESKIKQKIQ